MTVPERQTGPGKLESDKLPGQRDTSRVPGATVRGDRILIEVIYPKTLLAPPTAEPPLCTWARSSGGEHLESTLDGTEATDRWQFDTVESASAFMGETISRLEGALFSRDSTAFFGQPFRVVYQGKQAAAGRVGQKTSGHVD